MVTAIIIQWLWGSVGLWVGPMPQGPEVGQLFEKAPQPKHPLLLSLEDRLQVLTMNS